jgi:glycosyltransferase involved in cell wall biosynthesis
MKVLHVTEAYGGGVLTVVNQLANGLVENNIDVTFALSVRPEAPPDWRSLLNKHVDVRLLELNREINPIQDFKALIQLIRLIRQERPDVLHLHSSKAGFLGRVAAWLTAQSSRTFYSPHAFAYLAPHLSPAKRRLYLLLERIGAMFGGLLIACSDDELAEARKLGVRAVVVNNAIDLPLVDDIADRIPRIADGKVRIVTAGRICAAKRPEFFVAVAEAARKLKLDCDFIWIGGGDKPPQTDAVHFTGWLPRKEALGTMRALGDVYLQTSAYEGLPVAVLEAQALGLPAVVTNAVGNRSSIVDGVTGFISSTDSVSECVERLRCLIEQPELRTTMGTSARERIESEFNIPLMLARYVNNYKAGARE